MARTLFPLFGVAALIIASQSACGSPKVSTCGPVTYPETHTVGVITIDKGELSCESAKHVIDRFLTDTSLTHAGNTMSAEFDGWLCASPTATASDAEGYSTVCSRGQDDQVTIRQPGHTSPSDAQCDAAAVNRDLANEYTVERCYGTWAYVDAGGLGDAQSLARLVDGTWTIYAGFPTSVCASKAKSDGAPDRELSSFPSC
jgi:hypothetical protein